MRMAYTLFAALAIGAACASAVEAAPGADADGTDVHRASNAPPPSRRELISKDEDIAARIRSGTVGGRPTSSSAPRHFDIEATADDGDDGSKSTFLLHVDQMAPAITPETTFAFHPSRQFKKRFVDDMATLASNPRREGEFTLLSVDTQSGDVRGLQRDGAGSTRRISLGEPGQGLRVRTVDRSLRNFTCGAEHAHDDDRRDHAGDHRGHNADGPRERGLFNDYHNDETFKVFNPDQHHLHHKSDSVRNGQGKHRFVINLLVAIDSDLINRQGNVQRAVRYVDFLVNSANVVYEAELDARINVVRVEETDIFDNVNELRTGLRILRQKYQGTVGNGGVDLVHAMLGRDLGGGIAFIDSVCDELWGVGLSSGLRGVMNDLDGEAMYDSFVVTHEIGHSLGSGHTFDGYDPPVDTCGAECPAGLLDNSATLMSYCNFCEGGLDNIALTLGGVWNGEGSRRNVNAWKKSPELVASSISTDPQRVSHRIWNSLTAKGQCINPALKPTRSPTAPPTTAAPTSSPTSSPSKSPSYYPDLPEDGRRWIRPVEHCLEEQNCAAASGVMFDIEHAYDPSSYGLLVEALQFEHMHRNQTVEVYATINGTYVGSEHLSDQWSKIATIDVDEAQSYSEVVLDAPIVIPPNTKRGFYLATSNAEVFFLVGSGMTASSGSNEASIRGGLVVFDTFGVNADGFYATVQAGYTMALPPTRSPTSSPSLPPTSSPTTQTPSLGPIRSPTMSPTTQQPTSSPITNYGPFSIAPEYTCDKDCFAVPGFMFSAKNSKKSSKPVIITAVSFEHLSPKQSRSVDLYRTVSGSYAGKEQIPEQWIKVASLKVPRQKFQFKEFVLDTPITLARGEVVSLYLQADENILLVGKNKRQNDVPSSDGRLQLSCGSAIMNGEFGAPFEGYSWNGALTYSTAALL